MRTRKVFSLFSGAAAAFMLLTGCNVIYEITQPKDVVATPFLPHHELLVKQSAKFPFQYFYLKKDAKRPANVYIAPVNTSYLRKADNWEKFDQHLAGKLGTDVQDLANFMRKSFINEIKNVKSKTPPRLVDSPKGKDTVVIECAIVGIAPNKAELTALGLAGNLLVPGISLVTSQLAAGSIALEGKSYNAETGEILAMFSAVFNDQSAILNLNSLSWYGSAKRSIERAARYCAQIGATRDYSSVKRDFPVQLISL